MWWQISHRFESENQSLQNIYIYIYIYIYIRGKVLSITSVKLTKVVCGLGNFLLLFLMKVESLRIAVDIENRDLARHSKTENKETYLISTLENHPSRYCQVESMSTDLIPRFKLPSYNCVKWPYRWSRNNHYKAKISKTLMAHMLTSDFSKH